MKDCYIKIGGAQPVILAVWEAEAGGAQVQAHPGQFSNLARGLCLRILKTG